MKSPRIRRPLAIASALAAGAAVLAGADPVHASHPAEDAVLTASNGGDVLQSADSRSLESSQTTITDAAWSPDGSRAVFVTTWNDRPVRARGRPRRHPGR
ncbi:hypothetical protein AAH979_33685 [Plantactinospora sp. ZYX-F-223]|uniref:hypothetical protein n=1 Tax=Plantactinospora sp. ZYX-F-223 TaxID=3144103 RepID=UPI0031FC5104